jgi:hypothetical protein
MTKMKRFYKHVGLPLLQSRPRQTWNQRYCHVVRRLANPPSRHSLFTQQFYSNENQKPIKACPSCGTPLEMREISCGNCGSLSPLPENINYLALFGLNSEQPFEFDINASKLKREYVKLMSKIHPDSVINKPDVISL